MSRSHELHLCKHGNRLIYTRALGTKVGVDGRLTRRNDPISEASPEQRAKVKDALSIISGQGPCDAAHVTPRGAGGCDHPDCVVPLLRHEHRDFDDGRLDILGALIAGHFWAEIGHAIVVHERPPTLLVERLTGEPYGPTAGLVRELEMAKARILELEASVHA